MNHTLAFSTFLKLLELDERRKGSVLRGFLRGGGFNYWRPLQQLAPEVARNALGLGELQSEVAAMCPSSLHQRKYNVNALTNLLKWTSRRKLVVRKRPEKLIKKFCNSGLSVKIEPELAFSMGEREYLMHIWATTSPTLSDETLSMGLFYFTHHMQAELDRDCRFLIFDSVRDRLFTEISVFDDAREMLSVQRSQLNDLWLDVSSSKSPKGQRVRDLEEARNSLRT